jgi:hypothetical protein
MRVLVKGDKLFNATTGNEMRFRWTPRILYYAAFGAYGWYMAHIVGRIGIRLGLGMIPNVIIVFSVVVGPLFLIQWVIWRRLGKRRVSRSRFTK